VIDAWLLLTTSPTSAPSRLNDMAAIEARILRELHLPPMYDVIKEVTPRDSGHRGVESRGEDYKLRLVEDMPDEQAMGLYYNRRIVGHVAPRFRHVRTHASSRPSS